MPPLSAWVRWAPQPGSRTGAGARVSVAGARMMRQLVRDAVTTWTRVTTAWRPTPLRTHAPTLLCGDPTTSPRTPHAVMKGSGGTLSGHD
ncbi:hypothetical protein [Streptomyces sp. Wh19]|uniref:Uncharacterized protein n=1 Tax=Streptomyces sanglieri TaxID=193460 RepID=A0ABW2X6U6_9ACTN|nr:hypothetical protein [Streptomyces sp. Wh19]MDV9200975.1 hypothetical protein [Streptomyces sp. Wh19]